MTAPVLTWGSQGFLATRTAQTNVGWLTDLKAVVDARRVADNTFPWEVKGSDLADSQFRYVLLGPVDPTKKGRALFWYFNAAPGGMTSRLYETSSAPGTTYMQVTYWPNATSNTVAKAKFAQFTGSGVSDLGAITDDDSQCCKASACQYAAAYYTYNLAIAANEEMFYVHEHQDSGGLQDNQGTMVGNVFLDANGDALPGVLVTGASASPGGFATVSQTAWADVSSSWPGSEFRSRVYFNGVAQIVQSIVAYSLTRSSFVGPADPLVDGGNQRVYFFPYLFMGQKDKGSYGIPVKLRQVGWGPGPSTARQTYNDGNGVKAISTAQATGSYSNGSIPLWLLQVSI